MFPFRAKKKYRPFPTALKFRHPLPSRTKHPLRLNCIEMGILINYLDHVTCSCTVNLACALFAACVGVVQWVQSRLRLVVVGRLGLRRKSVVMEINCFRYSLPCGGFSSSPLFTLLSVSSSFLCVVLLLKPIYILVWRNVP